MPPVGFFHRVAIVSFVVDTLLQAIALLEDAERSLSSPSAIYVAYSPHPYAPIAFFSAGVVLQVHWFLRLYSQQPYFQQEDSLQASSFGLPNSARNSDDDEESEEHSNGALMMGSYYLNAMYLKAERNAMQEPAHFAYLPFYILGTMLQSSYRRPRILYRSLLTSY